MQNKQQIIRSWLKKKVEQLRNQNEEYQRYKRYFLYRFKDDDFIKFDLEECKKFGHISTEVVKYPTRTVINPSNSSTKLQIPGNTYLSCVMRVEYEKNEKFIAYRREYANPGWFSKVGLSVNSKVFFETGKIFDLSHDRIDTICEYCETQWKDSHVLRDYLSETVENRVDKIIVDEIANSWKTKYNINHEFCFQNGVFEDWAEDDLDKISDEKLDEIILWEWII